MTNKNGDEFKYLKNTALKVDTLNNAFSTEFRIIQYNDILTPQLSHRNLTWRSIASNLMVNHYITQ